MNRLDLISIFGLILAVLAIVLGQYFEGGHISSLIQITAFLIVFGGTTGAVMLQSPLPVFKEGVKMVRWVFSPPAFDVEELISRITTWSNSARRGGLLALEGQIDFQTDPMARKGLQMLVDGMEPSIIRNAIEIEIDTWESHYRASAKIWESAGGYAPTVGILGAVLGLIHVMENLSDPSKLGSGIAVAFVATAYGVGSANLIFLPMANKLKSLIAQQIVLKEMLLAGLVSVASGDNPRVIEARLRGYVHGASPKSKRTKR